jgi:hypothetical protein
VKAELESNIVEETCMAGVRMANGIAIRQPSSATRWSKRIGTKRRIDYENFKQEIQSRLLRIGGILTASVHCCNQAIPTGC